MEDSLPERTADLLKTDEWRTQTYVLVANTPTQIADDLALRRLLCVTLLTFGAAIYVSPVPTQAMLFAVTNSDSKPVTINDWQYGPLVQGPWFVIASAACTISVVDISNK